MKKFILLAAAVPTLALAGCGASSSANQTVNPSSSTTNTTTSVAAKSVTQTATPATGLTSQNISMTVLPGGRLGPDGKMHDSFAPADVTVVQGVPVTLTVYNYDSGQHSVTNGDLNLNLMAKGSAKKGVPGVTSVTFTPTATGDFKWQCVMPCDGEAADWAMSHPGYMEGMIHVVPASTQEQDVYLTIKDGLQYAAADGKLHDSFSPANFTVQKGIPVKVHVENFDTGGHSLTSADLNLNQTFPAAKKTGEPSETTFTFTPDKDGQFKWLCIVPCDGASKPGGGWAMRNDGYMMGTITVTG